MSDHSAAPVRQQAFVRWGNAIVVLFSAEEEFVRRLAGAND